MSVGISRIHLEKRFPFDQLETVLNKLHSCPDLTLDQDAGRKTKSGFFVTTYYNFRYNHSPGIEWDVKVMDKIPGYIAQRMKLNLGEKPCSIIAKVNVKQFTGSTNCFTEDRTKKFVSRFNAECKQISPLLGMISDYTPSQFTSYIDFEFNKLEIQVPPEVYIMLLKKAFVPTEFQDLLKANVRQWTPTKYQLTGERCTIKCSTLQSLGLDRFGLRAEVTSFRTKTVQMWNNSHNDYTKMLSEKSCMRTVKDQLSHIVRDGDYYTILEAKKKIQSNRDLAFFEEAFIHVLAMSSNYGTWTDALATISAKDKNFVEIYIPWLKRLGINAVIIPSEFEYSTLPNLVTLYEKYRKECGWNAEGHAD